MLYCLLICVRSAFRLAFDCLAIFHNLAAKTASYGKKFLLRMASARHVEGVARQQLQLFLLLYDNQIFK